MQPRGLDELRVNEHQRGDAVEEDGVDRGQTFEDLCARVDVFCVATAASCCRG